VRDPHRLRGRVAAVSVHVELGVRPDDPNLRHVEYFHDHQRIEGLLFDGALDPDGGRLTSDPAQPGLGLSLREPDADHYRVS
jgi:hypothetical protein